MDPGGGRARDVLGSPLFSVVASWTVVAVAAVAVLSVATRSWLAALLVLGLYGAYVTVGFERLYGGASRRWNLGVGAEFVVRTVGFVCGAILLAAALSVLSVLPGAGAFGALEPASNPFRSGLAGAGLVSAWLVALALAGVVVASEGAAMLARRVLVARATPFVGGAATTGLVALTGHVRATSQVNELESAGGDWTGRSADDRHSSGGAVTDGGRVDGADPFAGTPFEPMEADSAPGAVPDPATFGDPTPAQSVRASTARGDGAASTARGDGAASTGRGGATALAGRVRSPPLERYDTDDPVVVDGDTGEVVATRGECAPEALRRAVVDWLAASFAERHGVDLRSLPEARHRLRVVADRAGADLAERTETEVLLPFIADGGEGATHIRRTLSTASPPDGGPTRPPFESVGVAPLDTEASIASRDRDGDLDLAVEDASVERTLVAPLTGEDCVAYRYRAWDRDRVAFGDGAWVTARHLTARDADAVAFEVETFGTPVRVDPDRVRLAAADPVVESSGDGLAYQETVAPGDTVTVVGDLRERGDGLVLGDAGGEGTMVTTGRSGDLARGLTLGGIARLVVGGGVAAFASAATPVVGAGALLGGAAGVGAVAATVRWNVHAHLAGRLLAASDRFRDRLRD